MIKSAVHSVLPDRFLNLIRSNPTIHRLRSGELNRMSVGIGAGLAFEPGPSNRAYASGDNELPLQNALGGCLKPGSVFYDVGANVGFFTVIGARLVGPSGTVYAFEPVPVNASYIRLNTRLNHFSHVVVVEAAVSSSSGRGNLQVADYSGGAALSTVEAPPDLKETIPVDLVSIDDFVFKQGNPAPAVVKIDVEGAEKDVLSGMSRSLQELRPVIVYEIDDATMDGFRRKYQGCEEFLQRFGYQSQRLEDSYPGIDWIVGHAIATPH